MACGSTFLGTMKPTRVPLSLWSLMCTTKYLDPPRTPFIAVVKSAGFAIRCSRGSTLGAQGLAALGATPCDDCAAGTGTHASAEAVLVRAATVAGLVSALCTHNFSCCLGGFPSSLVVALKRAQTNIKGTYPANLFQQAMARCDAFSELCLLEPIFAQAVSSCE